ncbi:hypothetical protein NHQ30_006233 [Ciborinia camelliae]|nr:hypothetical protein NHQ30_006233 [Ciborinia camelliae]
MGEMKLEDFQIWTRSTCERLKASEAAQMATDNPKLLLYGAGLVCLAAWLLIQAATMFKKPGHARPRTPDLEKPASRNGKAQRPLGGWYGPKPELDNHYMKFHDDKAKRIIERGARSCYTDPSAFDGAVELLEELCAYLPERYPTLYKRTPVGMDNLLTNESFNIVERPLAEDPMQMAARFTQDDLAIMFEKEDGQYYLLAGAILLAGFWRLEDKLGMPLSEIHTSGDVPGYKAKLEKGMMNFFRRVQPNGPVQRNNYFIQVDDQLAWSSSIGPEDGAPGTVSWDTAKKNKAVEHHWFRSERQTLRRLPRSGGVVFTIRTYFHPITEICEEPYVPGRLASAVRSWGDDVSKYKGKEKYGEVLLEYLDKRHNEQVEAGLDVEKEEEVRAYPY